jgi:hypothetical protein
VDRCPLCFPAFLGTQGHDGRNGESVGRGPSSLLLHPGRQAGVAMLHQTQISLRNIMNKQKALLKYEAAAKLRYTSHLSDWLKVFPGRASLEQFRLDFGNISFPENYGASAWDDAFSLAYELHHGISESSYGFYVAHGTEDGIRGKLRLLQHYGLELAPGLVRVLNGVVAASDKPLDFITVRDVKTGRASSLSIHGRRDEGALTVVGNLEHNARIVPDTVADCDKWIAWLQDWKGAQGK